MSLRTGLALALALLVAVAGCNGEDDGGGGGSPPDPDAGRTCDPPCASNEECWMGVSCQTRTCSEDPECGPEFLCSERRGICDVPRCTGAQDCAANEACDSDSGRCVATGCRNDEECGPNEECEVASGRCVELSGCRNDGDCVAPARCDEVSGACLGGACGGDEQCFPDEHCHASGSCVPGCHSDAGCGGDRTCDVSEHRCVGGPCGGDLECPAGLFCDLVEQGAEGTCRGGCRVDGCPEPAECDPALRECVGLECGEDADCPVSQYCSAEGCALGCRGDAYCSGGRLCDPDSHACHSPPCTEHAHCRVGEYCDPEQQRCSPGCADDLDCMPAETCDDHVCRGEPCAEHTDCVPGYYCEQQDSRCAPGCRGDEDCVGGICDPLGHTCRGCQSDDECQVDSYCDGALGDCLPGCRLEPDTCPDGDHCDEGLRSCVPDVQGCVDDGGCPADSYCEVELAECRPGCRLDGQSCQPLERCNERTRSCEAIVCAQDQECPAGHYCGEDQACLAGCRVGGDDCPPDQPCDPETHGCGCSADEQCPQGTVCAMARCVDGCRQDADCPVEQVCVAGLCAEGCRDDGLEDNDTLLTAAALRPEEEGPWDLVLCPGDEDWFSLVAEPGDTLELELTFAAADGDLDLELYCDDALLAAARSDDDGEHLRVDQAPNCRQLLLRVLGRDGGGNSGYGLSVDLRPYECPADEAEPNDRVAAATPVGEGAHEQMTLCQDDEDWYRLRLYPGTRLVARLRGPQRLELYAHDGLSVLALGRRDGDESVVDHVCGADGYYHLRVWDAVAGEPPAYSLAVELPPPLPECPDDLWEPNDVPLQAISVPDLGDSELYACPDNPDWYAVEVPQRSRLRAVFGAGPVGGVRALLWGPDEEEPRVQGQCAAGQQVELAADVASGRYLLEVGALAGSSGAYTLETTLEELVCAADHLEPNDARDEAAPLAESVEGLTLCAGDEDWFAVQVAEHEDMEVAIEFVHRDGDLDLELFAPDGSLLDRSESEDDGERLRRHNLDAGTYWVRVYGFWAQTETAYDVVLRVRDPREDCPPDDNEPNETPDAATDLVADLLPGVLCSPDEDWYRVLPAEGRPLRLRIEFFHYLGDLDLDVYGPDGVTLLGRSDSTSSRNYEEVLLPEPVAEPHFVRIYGLGGARNEYDLLVER